MKKLVMMLLLMFAFSVTYAAHSFAFSDVKKGSPYEASINWAVKQKVVSGFSDGTFRPNQNVTFDQFIKMYTNTYNFKKNNPKTFDEFYEVLEQYNLNFPNYVTKRDITRGDVSVLFAFAAGALPEYTAYPDLKHHYQKGAEYMLASKLSSGQNVGKQATAIYGSTNTLTRAQAVTFLYRATEMGLTTLAADVQHIVEPPIFDQQDRVLRSYNMGNGIVYNVMKHDNPIENYEVVITVNNLILGGYVAIEGANVYGLTIGKPFDNNYRYSYTYKLNRHTDSFENSKIRAISYQHKHGKYAEIAANAMRIYNVQAVENVAQLYADLANEFRVKNGQSQLKVHSVLAKAAKAHSVDMAKRDYFDHYTLEGLSPEERIANSGGIPNLFGWGENITAGRDSIFNAHHSWINSKGHRENMLNPKYTHIGFGAAFADTSTYGSYYTTKFAMVR